MRQITKCAAVMASLTMLALLTACSQSKLTTANYDRVTTGMNEQDVEAILGKGKEQASTSVAVPGQTVAGITVPGANTSAKVLTWQEGQKLISVTFLNGKVMSKTQFGL